MQFNLQEVIPIGLFLIFLIYLFITGFRNAGSSQYYNAGGKLPWFTICASIMGANITFEYILSSAANGFTTGLAYASFEWGASFVIIFTALYFIPKFMQVGILTLPEYLEHRYSKNVRTLTSVFFILTQFGMMVPILHANAIFLEKMFMVPKAVTIIFVAVFSGAIIYSGGLGSKVKLDKVVFILFLISALSVLYFSLRSTEGIHVFMENAHGRLKVILPSSHPVVPWTSVLIGGLWVLHVHYWTFFQPIAQTALASESLSETQKGFLAVASFKLFTPFLMIIPGIVAYEWLDAKVVDNDLALPGLLMFILPKGIITGVIAVGYMATMFSSYASYLNATSNICSLDIVQTFIPAETRQEKSVMITRICTVAFIILSVTAAVTFETKGALFNYTQIIFACVTPISTSIFLFAIFSRKTPSVAPVVVLLTGIPLFFILKEHLTLSVINLSGLTFLILSAFMGICRIAVPLKNRVEMPEKFAVKFERNLIVVIWSIFVLTAVFALYTIFI
jgi:solute:Na+ symporter, SSS family